MQEGKNDPENKKSKAISSTEVLDVSPVAWASV
jgi:hypothetical protein